MSADHRQLSAYVGAHRLWSSLVMYAMPEAVGAVVSLLIDDAQASDELLSAEDWLLSSAQRLPQGMASVQMMRLLSTSETLGDFQ